MINMNDLKLRNNFKYEGILRKGICVVVEANLVVVDDTHEEFQKPKL